MTYTDFQISMGIKSQDDRYPSILRGLIAELYTRYGIVISRDQEAYSETVNVEYNTPFSLKYKLISNVQFSGTEGIDYTVDYEAGTITILSTGSLLENTDYTITYNYTVFMNSSNTIVKQLYMDADTSIYRIGVKPIRSLSVSQAATPWVEETDYYFYDGKLEVVKQVDNYRVPLTLTIDAGYEELPFDLKQAFYELAKFRFDSLDKQTNLIASVDNGQTKTSYRSKPPEHIHCIFMNYSPLGYAYGS